MEPVWCLQKNTTSGFQFWSRLDRSPEQRSVRFKCDVEVREYIIPKEDNMDEKEEFRIGEKRPWSPEPYRLKRANDAEPGTLLLVASLAVVLITVGYKWWQMLV